MADQAATFADISRDASRATQMKTSGSSGAGKTKISFRDHYGKLVDVKKCGFLKKQSKGLIKKWDRRWFVVTSDRTKMIYWIDKDNMLKSEQPKGIIDISGCSISETEERTKKQFSFGLVHVSALYLAFFYSSHYLFQATRKPVFFQAESREEVCRSLCLQQA